MTPDDPIGRLSSLLGLACEPQDWGILNADAKRFDEFVRFAKEGQFRPIEEDLLLELVLASANERLLVDPTADVKGIEAICDRFSGGGRVPRALLGRLTGDEEFPLGSWLRRRASGDSQR